VLEERKTSKDVQRMMQDLVAIFEKVCQIVAYAHSRGVVHRDLKPENIMVGDYNSVYVMDWGIARDLTEQKRRRALHEVNGSTMDITQLLDARKVKGTPKYMSPEQALGVSDVDLRSDVFSLGLIFYEILAGHHPFEAESLRDTMHNIKQAPLPKLRSYFIPNELKSICAKALKKLPAERYQHAGPLAHDLHCSLSYKDVSVHRDNPFMWMWKFTRRHVVLTLAAIFIVTVAGILGATYASGVRYSTKLLDMADVRMRNAKRCEEVIQAWQKLKDIDESVRSHKVSKLRTRKHMSLVSARALFCAALKKHAHELSRREIEALKETWFAELTYYMQLDNVEGARETFREMADDGFLQPDNAIMLWTAEEIQRIKRYDEYLNPRQVSQAQKK
jgi:serine/threonine protein kinase